jgi:dinuclear metal center YbgI/SA1388 family protein
MLSSLKIPERFAMQLAKVVQILRQIAPLEAAESWDNVGLLAGDPNQNISGILLTIDLTAQVAAEVAEKKCDLIIAYHPPIFLPLKRVVSGNLVFDAIRQGIAIYSPHTALDAAAGGTNDVLAEAIGLTDCRPLRTGKSEPSQCKLATFVPAEHLEKLSRALFEAGAGQIGNYSSCSFRTAGTGTFFGQEGSHPAVGKSGRLEEAQEIRLETIVPLQKVADAVRALRANHPYEEPAFDLYPLTPDPTGRGMGRFGSLPHTQRQEIFDRIKKELNLTNLLIAGPTQGVITRAAVCAGSCGHMLDDAIAAGAEIYLTGEMRHHDAVKAAAAGITVVCTLHSNSERPTLRRLKSRLEQTTGMPPIAISSKDRDPFSIFG